MSESDLQRGDTPEVAVIIPTHNAEGCLAAQLGALAAQTTSCRFEVIVVLNRCTDASRAVAEVFASVLDMVIVEANRRPSAAYARNAGAHAARSDVFLFCDADDEVDAGWIDAMLTALFSADFVGGEIEVDRTQTPAWAYERFYKKQDQRSLLLRDDRLLYPISASMGIRAKAFAAVNGFDESFAGAAGEEADLAIRLVRTGHRVGVAHGAPLRYTPRGNLKSILRQQRAYTYAKARLSAEELLQSPPVDIGWRARHGLRVVAYRIVRQHVWHPSAIVAEVAEEYYRYAAAVAVRDAPPRPLDGVDSDSIDFVVPPDTPLIGGLGLLARRSVAKWYARHGIESASLGLVDALLRPGDCFVDVGANIGTYSVAAALKVGPTGRVIAFEPDPRTSSLLQRNLARHGVVDRSDVRPNAVAASASSLEIILYENDVVSGTSSKSEVFHPGAIEQTLRVDAVAIDDVVSQPIDMMKIDVEGYEVEALAGACRTLQNNPTAILIVEINPAAQEATGLGVDDLIAAIAGDTRSCWVVEEASRGQAARVRELDDTVREEIRNADPSWYANILAAPRDRADEVRDAIARVLQNAQAPPVVRTSSARPARSILERANRLARERLPREVVLARRVRRAVDRGERELLLVGALLAPKEVFIDIGANRGIYSAAAVLQNAWVEAYEPVVARRPDLEWTIGESGRVHTMAIGPETGSVDFYVPSRDGRDIETRASLDPDANPGFENRKLTVDCAPLDSQVSWADVIKIDVEGAEHQVVASGRQLLTMAKPALLVEIERRHHDPELTLDLLAELGYEGFFLDPSTKKLRLLPMCAFSFDRYQRPADQKAPGQPRTDDYINNFIFLHSSRLDDYVVRLSDSSVAVER